jgi:hypothetical protein
MDDTFAFRADRMPRRRIDPLALKMAVLAAIVVALTGIFARFVIESEQRSVASADVSARGVGRAVDAPRDYIDPELDASARSAAQTALDAALATLARDGSLAAAGTTEMADMGTGLIFVDGPSTTQQVVSLASAGDTWAAAVMGASGTCFYARVTAVGVQTFGTGSECTGDAALQAATLPSWDV